MKAGCEEHQEKYPFDALYDELEWNPGNRDDRSQADCRENIVGWPFGHEQACDVHKHSQKLQAGIQRVNR
jgi:hypothetical protein